MNRNQSLNIPRVEQLGVLDSAEALINILDEHGIRRNISSLNWPLATFATAHDGKTLWIDFLVRCNYLRAENYTDQSPVSQDSCVEVFLKPENSEEYWNFEFNCIGTANASHRVRRSEPTRLSAAELSSIVRHPSCGTRPFCELEGLFTWNLLVGIPLSLMGVEAQKGSARLKGNFYKCASACSMPHYMSWNPIDTPKPDFHRPEFFGDIILE